MLSSGLLLCSPGIASVTHVHVLLSKSLQIRSKQITFVIPRFVSNALETSMASRTLYTREGFVTSRFAV